MAAKKPLVMTNGQIEQLQAGDTLDATVSEVDVYTLTAGTGGWTIGMPVYISGADAGIKAKADAIGTTRVFGFAKSTVSESSTGIIQTNGLLTLTTEQWDAIAGTTGGLTAGTVYYLSGATAGNITSIAPTSGYILELGKAVSTTTLEINIKSLIKL